MDIKLVVAKKKVKKGKNRNEWCQEWTVAEIRTVHLEHVLSEIQIGVNSRFDYQLSVE